MPVVRRLAEIRARYGPDHLVSRAITRSAPELTSAVARVTSRQACSAEAHVMTAAGRTRILATAS